MRAITGVFGLIFIIMVIGAGCVSSGEVGNDKAVTTSTLRSAVTAPSGSDEMRVVPSDSGRSNCTIVTQYGGRVKSCSESILPETSDTPSSTIKPVQTQAPSTPAPDVEGMDIRGKWNITSGHLSSFPDLQFIGDGEFYSDGSYTFSTHPREFPREEGVIRFSGKYIVDGVELEGSGKSTIYQKGEVFGDPANDIISGIVDSSGLRIDGSVLSMSSFHAGGEQANATFDFTLEKIG